MVPRLMEQQAERILPPGERVAWGGGYPAREPIFVDHENACASAVGGVLPNHADPMAERPKGASQKSRFCRRSQAVSIDVKRRAVDLQRVGAGRVEKCAGSDRHSFRVTRIEAKRKRRRRGK